MTDDGEAHGRGRRLGAGRPARRPGLTVVEMMHAAVDRPAARHVHHGREPHALRPQHHPRGGGAARAGLPGRAGHLPQRVGASWPTWCCRPRPRWKRTAPSPTPNAACSCSTPSCTRRARRCPTGRSPARWATALDDEAGRAAGAVRWQFDSTAAIMAEAASVTPIYGGMRAPAAWRRRPHLALPDAGPSGHADPAHASGSAAAWASSMPSRPNCRPRCPTPSTR